MVTGAIYAQFLKDSNTCRVMFAKAVLATASLIPVGD